MEITVEITRYIMVYYSHLLTDNESAAYRHTMGLEKLNGDRGGRYEAYLKRGFISEKQEVLDLVKNGYDEFALNCTKRILSEHPEKVYFNLCPTCSELARTPLARQCRFCGHNWH